MAPTDGNAAQSSDPDATKRSSEANASADAIMEIVERIGRPDEALEAILAECVRATCADTGRLYMVSLATASFHVFSQSNRGDRPPEIDLTAVPRETYGAESDPRPQSLLEEIIRVRTPVVLSDVNAEPKSRWHSSDARSRIVMPLVREQTCVGLLDLDSNRLDQFDETDLGYLRHAACVASLLCEKQQALRLQKKVQEPIDCHQPWHDFVDCLILMAAEATQMPYIALREWDGHQRLACIGHLGFGQVERSTLDLEPLEHFPAFLRATAMGEMVVEADVDKPTPEIPRRIAALKDVKSFMVAPVIAGDDVFGTLSVGAEVACTYTELEKDGLMVVANAIGGAITNFRNLAVREETVSQQVKVGAALTAIEVTQAARHEVRNYLSQAALVATNVYAISQTQGQIDRDGLAQRIEGLVEHLRNAGHSLDRIKSIARPPERELQQVSLRRLLQDTFDLVRGRLADLSVIVQIDGSDIQIEAYPDYLRHAFLNLILNSIDAFRSLRRRRDRHIRVYIDLASDRAGAIRVRYVDNATGIDVTGLGPTHPGRVRAPDDIFQPGCTSKSDGSGFGLYIARQIISDHGGSIALKDWRNGVTFEITLVKQLSHRQ